MDLLTLLLTAIGLSMDAFAVSIGNGILLGRATPVQTCRIAGVFGLFQGIMPMIGYLVAGLFAAQIVAIDHWVAFGLLLFIGGKMLWEAIHGEDEATDGDPTRWGTLLMMAVATSIDAMAVGVTMALGRTGLLAPWYGYLICCSVIAAITFATCLVGVQLGCHTGNRYGKRAEVAGGIVLVGIGVKIFCEHLLTGG